MNKCCKIIIGICSTVLPMTISAQTPTQEALQKIANVINAVKQQDFTHAEQKTFKKLSQWRNQLSKDNTIIGNYTVSHMARIISIPHDPWGQILLKLTSEFQSRMMLEIGMCIGMSAAYMAAGSPEGKILTYENFAPLVPLAQDIFNYINISNVEIFLSNKSNDSLSAGSTDQSFADRIAVSQPFDFVFDDHIHKATPVLNYFNMITPHLANQAIYLFDDIMRNASMESAWKKIKHDPRVAITVTLTQGICYHDFDHPVPRLGICILDKNITEKIHCDINLATCKGVMVKDNCLIEQN